MADPVNPFTGPEASNPFLPSAGGNGEHAESQEVLAEQEMAAAGQQQAMSNYSEKLIEQKEKELMDCIAKNYGRIREVERELANLQLQLKLTAGPKKHALEHLRKKIEIQNDKVASVRRQHAAAKQTYERLDAQLKHEESQKERLCDELNILVQQAAKAQLNKLEELKTHLESLYSPANIMVGDQPSSEQVLEAAAAAAAAAADALTRQQAANGASGAPPAATSGVQAAPSPTAAELAEQRRQQVAAAAAAEEARQREEAAAAEAAAARSRHISLNPAGPAANANGAPRRASRTAAGAQHEGATSPSAAMQTSQQAQAGPPRQAPPRAAGAPGGGSARSGGGAQRSDANGQFFGFDT